MESSVAFKQGKAAAALAAIVTQQRFTATEIEDRVRRIETTLLTQSRHLRQPNFERIHSRDLEILFGACDQAIFRGCFSNALGNTPLRFRLSSRVSFVFEGTRLQGRVNRVTKRATVLVEDAAGQRYSDGRSYRKYYVPLAALEALSSSSVPDSPPSVNAQSV